MSKKKLLIVTGIYPPDIGGPATYAKLLADGMTDVYDIEVRSYSGMLRGFPAFFRKAIFAMQIFFSAKKADTVYALSTMGVGRTAMRAAQWHKKKFFVRVAGDRVWEDAVNQGATTLLMNDFQKTPKRGKLGRLQRQQALVCSQARAVAVPSEYLASIVGGWGIARDRVHIVHNSVALPAVAGSAEAARKELGIPGKIILSIGRFVPWKGFQLLIKLMPQWLEVNPFFRLVLIGDGPQRASLEAMIKNLGLQQRVFLMGKKSQSEVARFLTAADIFILNTGYEGFSHQIIEAMAYGVPVITTNVGGNREIIRQGENGFMVKYNDEFNLTEAVKTLWRDTELRQHFIEEGKKTAAQYSTERTLEETKAFLAL